MIIPSRLQQQFNYISPYLKHTSKTVDTTVSTFCSKSGFAYINRIKTLDSLAEKSRPVDSRDGPILMICLHAL